MLGDYKFAAEEIQYAWEFEAEVAVSCLKVRGQFVGEVELVEKVWVESNCFRQDCCVDVVVT